MSENIAKYCRCAHSLKTGMYPKELRTLAQKAWENRGKLLKPNTLLNFYINAAVILDADIGNCAEMATDATNSTMRSRTLPDYNDFVKLITATVMAKHLCMWKAVIRGEQSLVNTATVNVIKDLVQAEVVRVIGQVYTAFMGGTAVHLPEILRYRYAGIISQRYRTVYAMESIFQYIRPELEAARLNLTLEQFTEYCKLYKDNLRAQNTSRVVADTLLRKYGIDMFAI